MATDTRQKNMTWSVRPDANGHYSFDSARLAVLMDIRDELQKLNSLLHCANFTGIPRTLQTISRKLPTRKKGE